MSDILIQYLHINGAALECNTLVHIGFTSLFIYVQKFLERKFFSIDILGDCKVHILTILALLMIYREISDLHIQVLKLFNEFSNCESIGCTAVKKLC
jgi:hypothetical protein